MCEDVRIPERRTGRSPGRVMGLGQGVQGILGAATAVVNVAIWLGVAALVVGVIVSGSRTGR